MIRLLGGGLLGFLLLALWIYCIFDVIASDEILIRNLPKLLWLIIVIFIPDIGSIAWLALGRPAYAGWRPGDTGSRPARRITGPEDLLSFPTSGHRSADDASTAEERLRRWEEDLRKREDDIRRREDGGTSPEGPPA